MAEYLETHMEPYTIKLQRQFVSSTSPLKNPTFFNNILFQNFFTILDQEQKRLFFGFCRIHSYIPQNSTILLEDTLREFNLAIKQLTMFHLIGCDISNKGYCPSDLRGLIWDELNNSSAKEYDYFVKKGVWIFPDGI